MVARQTPIYIVGILLLLLPSCETEQKTAYKPRLGGWDYDWMLKVKQGLASGDEKYAAALKALEAEADEALQGGVYSVTYKKLIPPSGSKHDYMSMGPYWWPDPSKPDGLPYIRRDGEINPERDALDSSQRSKMIDAVRSLTLAWFFTENPVYANKAAELLRVWFLDEETLMNPHLEYAQAIPGVNPGRFIGVIDAAGFHVLVDAIALLETSGAMTEDQKSGIRQWFQRYFRWLTESEHGKNEDAYKNNHSVAFDVQASGIAYFIGDEDYTARKARELPRRRIDPMIEADGSQPEELIRTKAFGYSVGNLGNFFNVGEKGLKVGVNVFDYVNAKGGSLQKALDYLVQYVGKQEAWPYEQITDWEKTENSLGLLIRKAAMHYNNEEYKRLWQEVFSDRLKADWSLLVIKGVE